MKKKNIVQDKSLDFAVKSVHLARHLVNRDREYVISKQFLKSATSIGANIEEGLYGQSRKDFSSKMSIALKEANETRYWLRIMHATQLGESKIVLALGKDICELIRILSSIVKSAKTKKRE